MFMRIEEDVPSVVTSQAIVAVVIILGMYIGTKYCLFAVNAKVPAAAVDIDGAIAFAPATTPTVICGLKGLDTEPTKTFAVILSVTTTLAETFILATFARPVIVKLLDNTKLLAMFDDRYIPVELVTITFAGDPAETIIELIDALGAKTKPPPDKTTMSPALAFAVDKIKSVVPEPVVTVATANVDIILYSP